MAENKNPEALQKQLEELKKWMSSQPHLPMNMEDMLLKRFLHSCYHDLEKTKAAVDHFYSIRASAPEILNDRDPSSPLMQKALSIVNLAQIKISGNRNLWIWQLNDPGLDRYDYTMDVKVLLLSIDAWLLDDESLEESDVGIIDVKDISLKFITKYNASVARKLTKYEEEAMPIRLKGLHVVNAAPFIDKIFSLMKPFLKKDITDVIHFHSPKSDTLHKYFAKDELPVEYGGTFGKMEDHMKIIMERISKKRDILMTDLWKAEKKTKNKTDAIDDRGSFRSLAID